MKNITANLNLRKLMAYADWKLLLFLILFLDVKLAVKIPIIILFFLLERDFRFGFKWKDSRLPLFYLLVLFIPFISIIINGTPLYTNYLLVLLTGTGFWLMCILAIHLVKLSVERNEAQTLYHTIIVFFLLNAIISTCNLVYMMIDAGSFNPYTYQGQYQKYFIGTGDHIRGITFDTSTTNAVLNALGAIYFLTKKNTPMLFICMGIILLTGSNFINLVVLLVFAILFLFKTGRDQKSLIAVCVMMLVLFMAKVSPQNNHYVQQVFTNLLNHNQITTPPPVTNDLPYWLKPDSVLSPNEIREKIAKLYLDSLNTIVAIKKGEVKLKQEKKIIINDNGRVLVPMADINSAPYQSLTTTPTEQLPLISFIDKNKAALPISSHQKTYPALPGKAIGVLQTMGFIKQHPKEILAGTGMGNFSSKLAFKASGLNITGGYPARYTYIDHDFETNHLDLYLNFFSKRSGFHSFTNSPFSVYDQLLAEYGLLGIVAFLIFYLGFFLKHYQTLTYGLPILLLIIIVLFIDYWFEQLSILIIFELLLFVDIKETTAKPLSAHA